MADRPTLWVIAGPNGVGKTTFALRRLEAVSGSFRFVNLDEIARGLSPLRPAAAERDAARIALERARTFIAARETFAIETTLAGKTQASLIAEAQAHDMAVSLLYFSVAEPAVLLDRIARRVAEGGHDVPAAIVERRFRRSLDNLPFYLAAADLWRVYEASGIKPSLALEGHRERRTFADPTVLRDAHPAIVALAADL